MSDIDRLKGTIGRRTGLAKANRFAVYFSLPIIDINPGTIFTNLMSGNKSILQAINDPRDAAFLCESVNLPGKQIATNDYSTTIRSTKKPYGYINEDVTLTFLLTGDYFAKNVFSQWQNAVYNKDMTMNYKSNYCATMTLQQLNEQDVPIYTVQLKNAFPTSVSAIELSNTSENTTSRITVTMAYDDWEEAAFAGAMLGIGTKVLNKIF